MPKSFSESHLMALDAWRAGTDESDGSLAARLGVSRQLISRWHAQSRGKVAAITATVNEKPHESNTTPSGTSPVGLDVGPRDPATITRHQRPADAEAQIDVMLANIAKGAAPRASALLSGMPASTFYHRMEHDREFAALVHAAQADAEAPLAQNLHRLGLGSGPQASASAIAWLERRSADWQRRDRVEHDVRVEERIDVAHILSSPALIQAVSAWEAAMQNADLADDVPQLASHAFEAESLDAGETEIPTK